MSANIFAFRPEIVVTVKMSKSVDFALTTPALGISRPEVLAPENWVVIFNTHPPVTCPQSPYQSKFQKSEVYKIN